MISRILDFSIRRRWVVVALVGVAAGVWACALTRLPIDAVPDITNKQVQINTTAPALSPVEIEKQVTFPHRDRACRHARAWKTPVAFAQRLLPGHGGLHAKRPTSISRASRSASV